MVAAAMVAAFAAAPATVAASPTVAGATDGEGYGQEHLQRDLDAIRDTGVTGVQARVTTTHGKPLVATSGVADTRTGAPVQSDGYYRIGSNGKTFVATVALQLVGEGKLSLDDTVAEHLPGMVAGNGNDGGKVTVRHLPQHTSGIYNYTHELGPVLSPPTRTTSPTGTTASSSRNWSPRLCATRPTSPPAPAGPTPTPTTSWSG